MEKKLITLFLTALLMGLGGGYFLGYVTYQPQMQKLQSNSFEEPPSLSVNINNLQNLKNDLENLDCKIFNFTRGKSTITNFLHVANYTEFRRVAYNTKIVFWDVSHESVLIPAGEIAPPLHVYVALFTLFNGIMVSSQLEFLA